MTACNYGMQFTNTLIAANRNIQTIIGIARWFLLPLTVGFIAFKLFYAYDFDVLIKSYQSVFKPNYIFLLAAVILMPLNWLLESIKWQKLVSRYESTTLSRACMGVLSGVCLSIFTPNQIGDFAGRILQLRQLNKLKGAVVAVVANTAQMAITLVAGIPALYALLINRGETLSLVYTAVGVLLMVFVYLYLNLGRIHSVFSSPRVKTYTVVFADYSKEELLHIFVLSVLRYTVFVVQYLFILRFYNVAIDASVAVTCIFATLCAQAFVPSFLLLELGLRGASALWFFGMFVSHVQIPGILLSAYTVWIVNLMIPALAGMVVLLKWKIQ